MRLGQFRFFPGGLGKFGLQTGGRLLSWMLVALIVAFAARWRTDMGPVARGSTAVTGGERAANLSRLDGDASDNADSGEQSNNETFALAYGIEEAKVDYEVFLNPDCSPKTDFYLYVREKPLHGTVRIDLDKNYTGYDSDSQRYKCNLLPVGSPSIFYRRNKGFVGRDYFTVEVFEPNGYVRSTRYAIDAR